MVQTNEKRYIEIAKGSPSNRGSVIPMKELGKYIKMAQRDHEQLFRSVFCYDEEILEHLKNYKTVRSYIGKFYSDSLIFDIDKGQNDDKFTLLRAKAFVAKLIDEWRLEETQLSIWFSGSGYHITTQDFFLFTPENNLPETYRATLTHYFPEADEKIYIRTGLIRIANTVNSKTGLYKVNIPHEDFKSMGVEDIKEWASKPRPLVKRENNIPIYPQLIIKGVSPKALQPQGDMIRQEPTRIITCAQKIFLEGSKEGTRHLNLLSMISVFRRQGVPFDGITTLANNWNNRGQGLDDYELRKQVKYIWDKGYTPSCHDKVLSKYCDPKCAHYKHKDLSIEIYNSKNLEKLFSKWAVSGVIQTALDLNEIYKLGHPHKIYPREFVYIQGDTGLGKSTLIMNWIINVARFKTLFISNEVGEELFYRRAIQIAHTMTKDQVYEHYQNGNHKDLAESISHIDTMFQGTTFADLKKKVAENEYKIVVVDVIDKMKVNKDDYTAKTDILALELKELAKVMNITIIGVHHISKAAASQTSLNVHSGKGSSALEQAADQVFSIEGIRDNTTRFLKSEKTRDENSFNISLFYDNSTYTMTQIL